MLTLRLVKWLRLSAGLGLLLLVAAQEKVCPWMLKAVEPPPEAAGTDTGQPLGGPVGERPADAHTKRQPLPYLLPDTTAPRWPAAWHSFTVRHTTGARDGVVSCGPRDSVSGQTGAGQIPAIHSQPWLDLQPRRLANVQPRVALGTPIRHPALHSSIIRTGPPTA